MTRDDLIDLMAQAHARVFAETADTTAAMRAALAAITNARCAVVPTSATTAQLAAGQTAQLYDPRRRSSALYGAMIKAGRVDKETDHDPS